MTTNNSNVPILSSTRRSAGVILNESVTRDEDAIPVPWARAVSEEMKLLFEDVNKNKSETHTLLQSINNLSEKLDKYVGEQAERDKSFEVRLTKLEDLVNETHRFCESNFDDIIQTKRTLSKEYRDDLDQIRGEIDRMRTVTNKSIDLNDSILEITKAPELKCPVFDETYKFRPMKFLKDLKDFIRASHYNPAQLSYLLSQSMSGMHSAWYDMARRHIHNLDDFEKLFREKFWNSETRRSVYRDLEFGKFRSGEKSSRYSYALRKINAAYDLDENLDEGRLIETLAAHFDKDLRLIIRVQKINKITDFVNVLSSLDAEDFNANKEKSRLYQNNVNQINLQKTGAFKKSFTEERGGSLNYPPQQNSRDKGPTFMEKYHDDSDLLKLDLAMGNQ